MLGDSGGGKKKKRSPVENRGVSFDGSVSITAASPLTLSNLHEPAQLRPLLLSPRMSVGNVVFFFFFAFFGFHTGEKMGVLNHHGTLLPVCFEQQFRVFVFLQESSSVMIR